MRREEEITREVSFQPVTGNIASPAAYYGDILDLRTYNEAGEETRQFIAGEEVRLEIYYTVTRRNGLGAWLAWHAKVKVYDDTGKLLGDETTTFTMAPWTEIDTEPVEPWKTPMVVKFKMPNKDFVGRVELWVGG